MQSFEAVSCHDLGGTLRSRTAAETLAWIRPRLGDFGITRVADVTGLDCIGIPVFVCIRPNAKNLAVAQGKGATKDLAALSAIMESIEDFHSENPRPPDLVGSYRKLSASFRLISPARLAPGYFPGQLDADRPLPWIRAVDLVTGEDVYLPHACVCLDTTIARPEYAGLAISSTGLASGNHYVEAVCHALFEVIERDAHARWLALPVPARHETQVDLDTITDPCKALLEAFAAAEVAVKVWDMTSPLGVPTFHCAIWDANPFRAVGTFAGAGTHLSSEIALSRALTEAAQSRLTLISGSRDDMFPAAYRSQRHAVAPAPPSPAAPGRPFARTAVPSRSFADILAGLLDRLRAHAHDEVLVVDHQRPEWGVPVVHAFVPGLRDLPL